MSLLQTSKIHAVVLNFDDLQGTYFEGGTDHSGNYTPVHNHYYTMPSKYAGLSWNGFEIWDTGKLCVWDSTYQTAMGSIGIPLGTVLTLGGQITSDQSFDFLGASFGMVGPLGGTPHYLSIHALGYLHDAIKYIVDLTRWDVLQSWNDQEMHEINFNFLGIDRLELYGDARMDEFTFVSVPEPTTMLLFGTGLASLIAVGRRRRN